MTAPRCAALARTTITTAGMTSWRTQGDMEMDDITISKEGERQYLEIAFQEWLEDNPAKLAALLEGFQKDIKDYNVVWALNRVAERLSPEEAILVALTSLANAAYGAKLGVRVISGEYKAHLAEYVATILWTSPIPGEKVDKRAGGGRRSEGSRRMTAELLKLIADSANRTLRDTECSKPVAQRAGRTPWDADLDDEIPF